MLVRITVTEDTFASQGVLTASWRVGTAGRWEASAPPHGPLTGCSVASGCDGRTDGQRPGVWKQEAVLPQDLAPEASQHHFCHSLFV